MTEERFKIVFDRLNELCEGDSAAREVSLEVERLAPELDGIDELRRLSEAVKEPPSGSYSST